MRKFIITSEGNFRYGDVRMHKDLLQGLDVCKAASKRVPSSSLEWPSGSGLDFVKAASKRVPSSSLEWPSGSGLDFVKGGGFYQFDYVSNRLLLTGRSYDFGEPQWDYIDTLRLPEALRGLAVLYEDRHLDVPIEYV